MIFYRTPLLGIGTIKGMGKDQLIDALKPDVDISGDVN
jgi:hypothetical protein